LLETLARSKVKLPLAPPFARFFPACLARGVYLAPSAYEAGFISTAHEGSSIDRACEIMSQAIAEL